MKIIITSAGIGSRFKKRGIYIPKYKIEVKGKSLYEWSLMSLVNFFDEEFIFVFRTEIFDNDFIKKINEKLGIKNYKCIVIDECTDGQATTVFKAKSLISDNDEIVIYNIDTYVDHCAIKKEDIKSHMDGFIPVFKVYSNNFSFIKINDQMKVIEITEKQPISDLGSIGFYYFRKWEDFKNIYLKYSSIIKLENKEVYIAPMYRYMIEKNKFIGMSIIDESLVNILGTPQDVELFEKNNIN